MEPSLFFSNSNELELSILELERVEFSPSKSNRTEPNFRAFQKILLIFVFASLKILQIFCKKIKKKNWRKDRFFKKIFKNLEHSGSRTWSRTSNFFELQKPGTKTRVFELELCLVPTLNEIESSSPLRRPARACAARRGLAPPLRHQI